MDWMALLSRHCIAPLAARKDGSAHLRAAREYEETQRWPPERLYSYRWRRLQEMLAFAYANSTFYQRRFRLAGLRPEEVRRPEDLAALPRLTKRDLQEYRDQIMVPAAAGRAHVEKRTSGSTGTPLRVLVDKAGMERKLASTIRHNRWAGYDIGDAVGLIWGDIESPRRLRSRLRRLLLDRYQVLDSQRISVQAMERFAEALRRRRIRCLVGQAQPLYLFAEFVRERGMRDLPVRSVIPTGLMLYEKQRRLIEDALCCEVFNRYGAEETSIISSECEAHRGLHINAEGLWLEIVRGETEAAPGEEGELLVTDLVNRAMPLLRYEIGDVVVPSAEACPCGRTLPLLERVSGRVADCITSPDGFVVSGIAITDHVTAIPGVGQMQVVQDLPDHLWFRIVMTAEWGPGSARLLGQLVGRIFGPRMRFDCEFVPEIAPDLAGKWRFSISRVKARLG